MPISTVPATVPRHARFHRCCDPDRRRGPPGLGRGPRLQRPSRVHHRGSARRRRARVARPGAGRTALERAALAPAPGHGQPGPVVASEKEEPGSTWPSPWACWWPRANFPPDCTEGLAFCGELGLNGSLRHVPGMIALADATAPLELVVPLCDAREAFLVRGDGGHGVSSLAELAQILRARTDWPAIPPAQPAPPPPDIARSGRRQGTALRAPRPRGGGRRAAPPLDGGPAGIGQDNVGRAPARPVACA